MFRRRYAYADGSATAGAGTAGLQVARVIRMIAMLVVAVIALGIVLVVLDANSSTAIVGWIEDAARWLTTPFHGLFNLDDHKLETAVNWGIAAVVYYLVAHLIARAFAR